jgi:hypothetical protein
MRNMILAVWACGLGLAWGANPAAPAPPLQPQPFSGWDTSLHLAGGDCKAVIVPAVSGRIVFFSLNGENVLYDEPGSGGKTLASAPNGFAIGGAHGDLGPESRPIPPHSLLWLGSWQWQSPRPSTVTLRSEPDLGVGVQMEKEVIMDPESGEIGLTHRIKNVSTAEVAYGLWDRTLCRGGGFLLLPLNKKSRFKEGWAIARKDAAGKTFYESEHPADPRAKVIDGLLVVAAKGDPIKIGADSDAGWVGYVVGRILFLKYFPYSPDGAYSERGYSVACTAEDRRIEWGPLSPESTLKSGETLVFPEKWVLLDVPRPIRTHAQARALARGLPASPFGRPVTK